MLQHLDSKCSKTLIFKAPIQKLKLTYQTHANVHIADVKQEKKKQFCRSLCRGVVRHKLTELLRYTNCYFTPHISVLPPFLVYFLVKAAVAHE